tara:strand:- start:647 stop:781 length:135 start_codon:yes stop_codon:yes gene_type:complete
MQVWTLNLKDYETGYTTQIFIEASSYNKAFEILTKWYRGWEVIQ